MHLGQVKCVGDTDEQMVRLYYLENSTPLQPYLKREVAYKSRFFFVFLHASVLSSAPGLEDIQTLLSIIHSIKVGAISQLLL